MPSDGVRSCPADCSTSPPPGLRTPKWRSAWLCTVRFVAPAGESLEEPLDLAARLPQAAAGTGAVLLDCVTIWLSNLLFQQREEEKVIARVEAFLAVLPQIDAPLFMVSNELGSGIVPQNRLARQFRDLAGSVNQRLAAAADEAWLVASGIPMRLK